MQFKTSNENVLKSLRASLSVKKAVISKVEQHELKLAGKFLKAERERRTEVSIFVRCFALYHAPSLAQVEARLKGRAAQLDWKYENAEDIKLLAKAESLIGHLTDVPKSDYREFESREFDSVLRTKRLESGTLPNYVIKAYFDVVLGFTDWDFYDEDTTTEVVKKQSE